MPTPRKLCEMAATVRAKRERRKEARPGELLAAALDLFVEKGFASTRLEDVARRAGVSKSMLSQIERAQANPTVAVVWR